MRKWAFALIMIASLLSTQPTLAVMYVVQDLGVLGGQENNAYGVNDSEHVVGSYVTYQERAFLWQDLTMRDIGWPSGGVSRANAINNLGKVVGRSVFPGNNYKHVFLWQNGTMSDLGTLGEGELQATARPMFCPVFAREILLAGILCPQGVKSMNLYHLRTGLVSVGKIDFDEPTLRMIAYDSF